MSAQAQQYKQLTLGQQYRTQARRRRTGHVQKEIAETVEVSESALSR